MEANDIVKSIVNVSVLLQDGKKSFYALLEETGFYGSGSEISEKDVARELLMNPAAVKYWLQFGEDNRGSGWRVFRTEDNVFHVANMVHGEFLQDSIFPDAISSCACYIVLELDFLKRVLGGDEEAKQRGY